MARFAVISDVHSDVAALRDALVQIDAIGVDGILCCGDLVDYGRFPDETLALLRERGATCIRGNHDRWVNGGTTTFAMGIPLSAASLEMLAGLPASRRVVVDGIAVEVHHGRPGSDMQGIPSDTSEYELGRMLDELAADVLLVGHTHRPFVREVPTRRGSGLVANPGALLREAPPTWDIHTPGTFAILSIEDGAIELEIRSTK